MWDVWLDLADGHEPCARQSRALRCDVFRNRSRLSCITTTLLCAAWVWHVVTCGTPSSSLVLTCTYTCSGVVRPALTTACHTVTQHCIGLSHTLLRAVASLVLSTVSTTCRLRMPGPVSPMVYVCDDHTGDERALVALQVPNEVPQHRLGQLQPSQHSMPQSAHLRVHCLFRQLLGLRNIYYWCE